MQKIAPLLWFDNEAENAALFYVSIFKNSKMGSISYYGDEGPGPKDLAMMVTFTLEGQEFMALNGGGMPGTPKPQGVSFFVNCETQEEIDVLWDQLSDGGTQMQCGWLTDKFGISWNIVPTILGQLMSGSDKEKAKRAMQVMLKMKKLIIKDLELA